MNDTIKTPEDVARHLKLPFLGLVPSPARLPDGRRWQLHTVRGRAHVYAVAWSPDGQRVVTGSEDHTARIWDAETGQEKVILKGHSSKVVSVAWSPDGKRVLTGGDKTARVWDARAGESLFELTGHKPYLEKAVAWTKVLNEKFWRHDIGGYAMTADDGEERLVRVRTVLDGATPSANGMMMHVLGRLFGLTGDKMHAERYSVLTQAFAEDARRQPAAAATYYCGFDLILRAVQIVIVGDKASAGVAAFRDVFRRTNLVNKMILNIAPGEALYAGHPAFGKGQVDGKVTVYVCSGQTCSLPITDPNQLEVQLKTRVVNGGATAA